ncbi:hypothetical protein HPB47_009189 [Ixodes persulcatus]|uniref:Uncharacterized protein n=1 Tax=Ixodes persulcatus TaxID=34615 RepID=A0AC60P2N7_IXOPE|nr:hypothetical protein HPB47_009189 [Ixodes persulcatus]
MGAKAGSEGKADRDDRGHVVALLWRLLLVLSCCGGSCQAQHHRVQAPSVAKAMGGRGIPTPAIGRDISHTWYITPRGI